VEALGIFFEFCNDEIVADSCARQLDYIVHG
jgi:hypothetical protein